MNTFKLAEDLNNIYFKNLDRIDEKIIYSNILSRLKKQPGVFLASEELVLPYADITRGTYKSISFYVGLDLNHGTFIHCDNQKCLNEIELLLQNN